MGLYFGENIMNYLVVTFTITYLKIVVDTDTSTILWWMFIAHATHFAAIPLAGRLSDRIGRPPVYLFGAVMAGAWGFYAHPMMNSGHNTVIIIGLIYHAFMYATQPATMAEMFPTRMRYFGVALGYQVTSIVAGSLAPIIAVDLLETFDSSVPIALYLAAACTVTAVAVLYTRETKGLALEGIDLTDAEREQSGTRWPLWGDVAEHAEHAGDDPRGRTDRSDSTRREIRGRRVFRAQTSMFPGTPHRPEAKSLQTVLHHNCAEITAATRPRFDAMLRHNDHKR